MPSMRQPSPRAFLQAAAVAAWLAAAAQATPLGKQVVSNSSNTAEVNFSNSTGPPQKLAAGTLYGIPLAEHQIPSHFYTDMGWNYERAGGAQLPAPARGWIWGVEEYKNRWKSVVDNFQTTQFEGGRFIFLIHDLWGADGTQNASAPYPGDDGDWSFWDEYLSYVFPDMRAAGMADAGVIVDIWNEPDLSFFWNRSQDQYLQMWGRTWHAFRREFGPAVLMSGPAAAEEPLPGDSWWEAWCSFVAGNRSAPDQYAWHMESGGGDMLSAYGGFVDFLEQYKLPRNPLNINEYSTYPEQVPAGSAWWIAQLERVDAHGLRGNWLDGLALHDFLASLLSKPGADGNYSATETGYFPNGDYQVYRYYNQQMTGRRVGTLPSGDLKLDAFATVADDGTARVLAGVRITTGTWVLKLNDLEVLGLPKDGEVFVETLAFPVAADVYFGEVNGPTSLGVSSYKYSGGSLEIPIDQTDETTAYAFEFAAWR